MNTSISHDMQSAPINTHNKVDAKASTDKSTEKEQDLNYASRGSVEISEQGKQRLAQEQQRNSSAAKTADAKQGKSSEQQSQGLTLDLHSKLVAGKGNDAKAEGKEGESIDEKIKALKEKIAELKQQLEKLRNQPGSEEKQKQIEAQLNQLQMKLLELMKLKMNQKDQ